MFIPVKVHADVRAKIANRFGGWDNCKGTLGAWPDYAIVVCDGEIRAICMNARYLNLVPLTLRLWRVKKVCVASFILRGVSRLSERISVLSQYLREETDRVGVRGYPPVARYVQWSSSMIRIKRRGASGQPCLMEL
jgi:hypothetical protein